MHIREVRTNSSRNVYVRHDSLAWFDFHLLELDETVLVGILARAGQAAGRSLPRNGHDSSDLGPLRGTLGELLPIAEAGGLLLPH